MADDVADVPIGSLSDECQQQVNKIVLSSAVKVN
jgi:hypothetical protein